MAQPVAWFEIHGKNAAKSREFYSALFGWEIDANNPMNYGMVARRRGRDRRRHRRIAGSDGHGVHQRAERR